ncbi:uncharacterized protein LOC129724003 [Wyeomyia smithii]|uniref:uncharacterized protein LOC129724003 n=1 Tax=Wyeomyia smithii TaxID=174621 RepID=UPI002467DFCF|nr:uncharacterized protein LOC129724003 [Wyeomyia smithii]
MLPTVRFSSGLVFLLFLFAPTGDAVHTSDASNGSNNTLAQPRTAVYRDSMCVRTSLFAPRIGYGNYAEEGNWPWHGALFFGRDYQCGCTLINEWFVLTAAHCMFNPETQIRVNLRLFSVSLGLLWLDRYESNARRYNLTAAKIHPLFVQSSHKHDLALLQLFSKAEISDFIRPIDVDYSEPPWIDRLAGYHGTVVGWGFTELDVVSNVLMVTQMPIVRYTDCIESKPELFGQLIYEGMYCAGAQNGTSVCNGDSGGGMYVYQKNCWLLRGIVSFSATRNNTNLCDLSGLAGFVNVPYYGKWIQQQLADHERNLASQENSLQMMDPVTALPVTRVAKSQEIVQHPLNSSTPEGIPVENLPPECLQYYSDVMYAERSSSVSLHCEHNSSEQIQFIRWYRKGPHNRIIDLSFELEFRTDPVHDILTIRQLESHHSGRYYCLVQYSDRNITKSKILAVTGAIPRFNSRMEPSHLKYQLSPRPEYLNLVIVFQAERNDGIIFHKESECDEQFVTVSLVDGRPVLQFRSSEGIVERVTDANVTVHLGQWHKLHLYSLRDRAYFSLDNRLLALFQMPAPRSDCLKQDIYLGSGGENSSGFEGCISKLMLNDQPIDLWKEVVSKRNVTQCNACSTNRCFNEGVCVETRAGFDCLCKVGYVGKLCSQKGQSCNESSCNGYGFCEDHETGFRCFCSAARSGEHCEYENHLGQQAISFNLYGFAQYRIKIQKGFILQFNFTPKTIEKSLVSYLTEESQVIAGFLALSIVDGRLELRFAASFELQPTVLKSSIVLKESSWHTVTVGCGSVFVYFYVDNEPEQSKSISGSLFPTDREYLLYLGGLDRHSIVSRCPDVERGFHGCIEKLKVSDETVNLTNDFINANNIKNCE